MYSSRGEPMKPPMAHLCKRCGKLGDADADGWPDWDICAECAGLRSSASTTNKEVKE